MTLRPRALRRTIEEMYAAHCVLWNLGFSPDELFVSTPNVLNGDPPGHYATLTVRRGELRFIYNLPPRLEEIDCDRFLSSWLAFGGKVKELPIAELDRLVKKSDVWRRKASFLAALTVKGFRFTAVEN